MVWLKPGSDLGVTALQEFLGSRLAPYKVPIKIWLAEGALPKLGSEKIDKVSLRSKYRDAYATEVAA